MRAYVTYLVKINRPTAASVVADSSTELRGDEVFVDGKRLGRLPYYPRQLVKEGGWSLTDIRIVSPEDKPGAICTIAKEG